MDSKIIGPYVHSAPLGESGWKVGQMQGGKYTRLRNATNRDMRELKNYDTGRPVLEGHPYRGKNPDAEYN